MKNKKISQLVITIIFTGIVITSFCFLYDTFALHTYHKVVSHDYVLQASQSYNDDSNIKMDGFVIHEDVDTARIGGGIIKIENSNAFKEQYGIQEQQVLSLEVYSKLKGKEETVPLLETTFILQPGMDVYKIPFKESLDGIKIKELDTYYFRLSTDNYEVIVPMDIKDMKPIKSESKEYRLEDAAINGNVLRIGKLVSSGSMDSEYTNIALEYRYMKDPKGSIKDINNYVVFKKISTSIKEYMNMLESEVFVYEDEGILEDKKLSVVVILSKGQKEYVFSMDMEVDTVGMKYE